MAMYNQNAYQSQPPQHAQGWGNQQMQQEGYRQPAQQEGPQYGDEVNIYTFAQIHVM
jgi:hypothetical protein